MIYPCCVFCNAHMLHVATSASFPFTSAFQKSSNSSSGYNLVWIECITLYMSFLMIRDVSWPEGRSLKSLKKCVNLCYKAPKWAKNKWKCRNSDNCLKTYTPVMMWIEWNGCLVLSCSGKRYTSGPRYWNVPVLVNTGTFLVYQYCLKMWYLRSLERAGVIQKLTILERKNGLVLSNTHVPVSGTWSILFPFPVLFLLVCWYGCVFWVRDVVCVYLVLKWLYHLP